MGLKGLFRTKEVKNVTSTMMDNLKYEPKEDLINFILM